MRITPRNWPRNRLASRCCARRALVHSPHRLRTRLTQVRVVDEHGYFVIEVMPDREPLTVANFPGT